jgi:uncharacterized protein YutE (UPF0331/DUF86 family)
MVRPEVIRRRLQGLGEYLDILRRYHRYDLDQFLADPERYGSAERFLQLAIEATLDIGSHIVADDGLGPIDLARDVPLRLREHGVIDAELADRWIRMIGFRNILVHEYAELDRTIVFDVLRNRLGDLEALQAVFASFLT